MAFQEFYVETTGSDTAAGSTTGAAAVTSTNGDWGSVTANRFTPNGGGTPFSGVNVGDWASIYLDAATTLVYLAQVTAVNGSGATLDFSTTAKYGTAPATGATGRSVKIGGAHATPFAFLGTGTTAVYTSTRINIKAGTYASGATTRNFNNVGSLTQILLWRGYNTTPGDIDTNNALTKPVLTWGNVAVTFTGLKQQFWNLDFQSARSGAIGFNAQNEIAFNRCRFKNTNANAGSQVVSVDTTQGATFNYCYFEGPSILNRLVTVGIACGFSHCVFVGGQAGMDYSSNAYFIDHCVFLNQVTHGINVTTSVRLYAMGCTFRGQGGDGIHCTVAPGAGTAIVWCSFDTITGIAINNASGTNTQQTYMACNDFAACGGIIAGFGDHPQYLSTTETSSFGTSSSDPTFSSPSFNGASYRQDYENAAITGAYWDIGATQRSAGGGTTGRVQRVVMVRSLPTY